MSIYVLECQKPSYFNTVSWLLSIMFGSTLLGSFFQLPLDLGLSSKVCPFPAEFPPLSPIAKTDVSKTVAHTVV